jgi:wobble nucleotide-excising tRNase
VNISTEPNQPFAAKDVLSEGDKSTIALAFFLSKLDVENDKANKVLIFDDPLSSFDAKRRRKTINLLAALSRDSKQLVVLSHDKKFLFDLHRLARSVTKKGLKITFDSTIPSSKFEFLDIERMLQNEYFICLNKIKEFIQNGTDGQKEELRREIRIALENYIIFQFYGHFNGDVPATFPRIIERLTALVAAGTLSFRDANSQQVLDDLRELDAISWDSHHGDGDIFDNRDEVQVADIDLTEFKGYLSTTLNLIEQRL